MTNIGENSLSVIDLITNTEILPRIPVGDFPFDIAITPNCVEESSHSNKVGEGKR